MLLKWYQHSSTTWAQWQLRCGKGVWLNIPFWQLSMWKWKQGGGRHADASQATAEEAFNVLCPYLHNAHTQTCREFQRCNGPKGRSWYIAWPPCRSSRYKKNVLGAKLGRWKDLEKCLWDIFKQQERGLAFFRDISGCFSDPFPRYCTIYFVNLEWLWNDWGSHLAVR